MKAPQGGSASKACGDQAAAAAAAAAAGKQFIQVGLPAIVYKNFNRNEGTTRRQRIKGLW
jgi:hypothetical protein